MSDQTSSRREFLKRTALSVGGLTVSTGICAGAFAQRTDNLNRQGTQWVPLEWQLQNASFEGNPFDLEAKVTFVRSEDGEQRTTGMFYDGSGTWKFRFTATKPGTWTFTTQSADTDLNGYTGTVAIAPTAGSYGFVTHRANLWARQKDVSGQLEAFIPQFVMYESPQYFFRKPECVEQDIVTFLVDHGFTGFHIPVYCHWFNIEKSQCGNISSPDPSPDIRTFEALEMLISKVHAAGGVVHIWMWGDDSRTMTPKKWGLNGSADKRLQRYIAARLGPLPGWTMGYGFDLWEWVTGEELSEWHDYMHQHLGWPHMLGARSETNELTQLSGTMDYSSYEQHRPDYSMYVQTIDKRPDKPAFSEDRFRIRDSDEHREKDYSMEGTRRGLWHSALAGGVANIWGNLIPEENNVEEKEGSYPYARPDWIKTYSRFFATRFSFDMIRENSIVLEGYALRSENRERYIIYIEDASTMIVDLSDMEGSQRMIAVDAKIPYREIDLDVIDPDKLTVTLESTSDWAVAIGSF
ncbi:DUF5060 domain-containing protein [Candidatus Neomarinimicrobiota bacterium]